MSSHTDRSVHAQERDKLKATPVSHGTPDRWRVTAFTQGNDLPWNAKTVFGCQCAYEHAEYSTSVQKGQMFFCLWAALDIVPAEARGLTARLDKFDVMTLLGVPR